MSIIRTPTAVRRVKLGLSKGWVEQRKDYGAYGAALEGSPDISIGSELINIPGFFLLDCKTKQTKTLIIKLFS